MKWLYIVFIVGLCVGGYFLYQECSHEFCLKNIVYKEIEPQNFVPNLNNEEKDIIRQILQQKFTYLGRGHQTFVFGSEDGQYVLKFFRFRRLKASELTHYLVQLPVFGTYFEHQEKKRVSRLDKLLVGYKTGFEFNKDNCGLIYVHFGTNPFIHQTVEVMDRYRIPHFIKLDNIFFVIQKRAVMTKQVLTELLNKNEIETAKQRISELLELFIKEYKRGVLDNDHNVLANTGFFEDQAMRLDVGQLKRELNKDRDYYIQDLNKIIYKRLIPWLSKNYPTHAKELIEYIEKEKVNLTNMLAKDTR